MKDFWQKDLHVLRDVLWPLLPPRARRFFRCVKPDQISIAYADLVNRFGRAAALMTLWNIPAAVETVQQYYRFAVLPFVELMLREKYRELENARSLKQRLWRSIHGRILEGLTGTVDNLVHLVVLAWTFSPGIGEPDEHTGFYNRYVLGRYCGILDLGHFFNCAAVAYLYGEEEGRKRGEQIERRQRWLRKQKWLVDWRNQKENCMGRWLADFLWGFAASADTIEDRSSDWFGIQLGQRMRAFRKNERIIEYSMRAWPHSEAWVDFTAQKWEIVFPQELWEKVVRPGWNGKGTALPVKVQLKHNGEKVEPYFREETE